MFLMMRKVNHNISAGNPPPIKQRSRRKNCNTTYPTMELDQVNKEGEENCSATYPATELDKVSGIWTQKHKHIHTYTSFN